MTEKIEHIPQKSPEATPLFERKIRINSGMTIGHIAIGLGIKSSNWLDNTLRNPVEKNTYINPKNPIQPAKHEEKYRWGEPRLGDEYKLIKFSGEFQLHRTRGNESIFMIIPTEQVRENDEIKKVAEATKNELEELNSDIQSA